MAEEKPEKTPPHTWTHEQKAELLEGIAEFISKGLATHNGNLNKLGWTYLMEKINERFTLKLSRDQVKNAKNKIRDLYVDMKFLRNQSGFGWDNEKQVVTANQATWDELIKSHPRQGFGKLKDKPFVLYDLAHQVFSGTFATGEMAEAERIPDLNDCPLTDITPSNRAAKQPSNAKQPAMILDPNDSDLELEPTSSAPSSKGS